MAGDRAERAQDRPVLAGLAGRIDRAEAALHAALGVDVGAGLFGIGRAGQDHVGAARAGVAMMALVDHERIGADLRGVELVGAEQPQHVHAAVQHMRQALAVCAGHKADIQRADAGRRGVQHVEAVPVGRQRTDLRRQAPAGRQHRGAVRTRQRRLADNDHRMFCVAQDLGKVVRAVVQRAHHRRPGAKLLGRIGQVGLGADQTDRHAGGEPALADAGIQYRRFLARVAADDQQRIGVFDAGDAGVEAVEVAPRHIQPRTVLAAVEVRRAQRDHELFQRQHALDVAQIAGHRADAVAADAAQFFPDGSEGFRPGRRHHFFPPPHPGAIKPAALQSVQGEARLVAQPLLVHVLIQPRQDAQHFRPAGVDTDVGADGVQHIDAIDLHQFPRPRDEGIGLRGQRADRAEVDDVGGQFGTQRAFDIGADFHMFAAPGGT